jgi:hypothetical protein
LEDDMWNLLTDKKPEPGQLCVIQFDSKGSSLRLCHYDNRESWTKRTESTDGEDINFFGMAETWFTENDDEEDWWEASFVRAWYPVPERLP